MQSELYVRRRIGTHSTTTEARAACAGDGGELLDLTNAEDARDVLPDPSSVFRVQGISDGTCWIDGEGNEVDSNIEVTDDPNAASQTLVANVTGQLLQQADESDLLSYICQQERPFDGNTGAHC